MPTKQLSDTLIHIWDALNHLKPVSTARKLLYWLLRSETVNTHEEELGAATSPYPAVWASASFDPGANIYWGGGVWNELDYYVDSVDGDDLHTGVSPDQAFKTISKLSTVLAVGVRAGLKCGSHWREQLTIPAENVTICSYGAGAAPILDAADIITSWSKTGGYTYVYESSPTTAAAYGEQYINGWEDGEFLVRATSIANCDATPGSHYPTAEYGKITWYVHASDGNNPGTNGMVYECSARNYGLVSQYDYAKITGIESRNNQNAGGSMSFARSATLTNVICRNGSKHNLIFADGCKLNGVQALDAYHHSSTFTLFVWNENTPLGLGISFTDCIADADTDGSTYVAASTGYYGHQNVSGNFGAVTFTGCVARHCYNGYGGGNVTSFSFTDCTGTNCLTIFNLEADVPITYTFTNCTQSVADALTSSLISSTLLNGHSVVVSGCNWTFAGFAGGGNLIYATRSLDVNIQNTTTDIGQSWKSTVAVHSPAVCNLYARNNHYHRTGAVTLVPYLISAATSTVDSDYNNFGEANMQFNIAGTTYTTVALYQAGTGQDAHSTIG